MVVEKEFSLNTSVFCSPVKRKIPVRHDFIESTLSPIRENLLLKIIGTPPKKFMSNERYTPNCYNNNNDVCRNLLIRSEDDTFNFKSKDFNENSSNIDNQLQNIITNTINPNYSLNILKCTDADVDVNSIKRKHHQFYSKILKNEFLDENCVDDCENFNILKTPVSSGKRLLKYSPLDNAKASSLFEKSPRVVYSNKTNDAIISPRKRIWIPDTASYKVLDAPGIIDDFYLKLLDWSQNNIIAVALGHKLYTYNPITENVNEVIDLTKHKETISSVAWSHYNPKNIAVGTSKGKVYYIDSEKCTTLSVRNAHKDRIGTIEWNESCFTTGGKDKNINHFDVRKKNNKVPVFTFKKHSHEICGLAWSPGGNILASGGNDNKMILWSCHSDKPIIESKAHEAAVRALSWSPNEYGVLASGGGSADRTIKIWDTLRFKNSISVTTNSQICNLIWSQHSKQLLSSHGYNENTISVWDFPKMEIVNKLKGHSSRVLQMALSPDGQDCATCAGDETVRFWNVFKYNEISDKKVSLSIKNLPTIR